MAFNAVEVAVPGTATPLATLLSLPADSTRICSQLTIRLSPGAANDAYLGESGVTTGTNRGIILRATDTMPTVIGGVGPSLLNLGDIYLIGTVAGANVVSIVYI